MYFGWRPVDRLPRRMCTNILVTVASPDTAAATTCCAAYRVDGCTEGTPVAFRLPANIGHCQDASSLMEARFPERIEP